MDACKWLRLKHQVYGTELKKNVMKRFIQKIKEDRTECFDDHFPCRSESCNRQHVTNWIKMFILYLHMKTDRIKAAETMLKGKNVAIEVIDEHIHLKQELEKFGLDIHDTYRLLNLLANAKQYDFEAKRIVAKLSTIRPMEKQERGLRNNCAIFARHLNKYKEIIPLAEKIVAMRIGKSEFLSLDAAVTETSEQYNLPIPTAAFRVINDIKDYNRVGGLKKQLAALCVQLYAVKKLCSQQNQAMVDLVKLQGRGITEEQVLSLSNFLDRNRDKLLEFLV